MLYNLLFIVVSMLIPITGVLAYRQGIKDGRAIIEKKPFIPIIKAPQQKQRLSIEDERLGKVLDNINSYDGTGIGQREVNT